MHENMVSIFRSSFPLSISFLVWYQEYLPVPYQSSYWENIEFIHNSIELLTPWIIENNIPTSWENNQFLFSCLVGRKETIKLEFVFAFAPLGIMKREARLTLRSEKIWEREKRETDWISKTKYVRLSFSSWSA